MAAGAEIDISGLQEAIKKAEKSIKDLAKTTKTQTEKIVESFDNLSKNGLSAFVQKLNEANEVLGKFGKTGNASGFESVKKDVKTTADEVVRLTNTLNDLKKADKLKIKIEDEKLSTKQQLNDIKELKNAEAERTRELERQNRINIYSGKKQEALTIKKITNATRELMNEERKRGRNLIEKDMENKLKHKENLIRLRQQIKEMERLAKAYKAMPANISTKNVGGLIGQSLNTKTINQRITAIHNLKNALKDLDLTTEKGKRTQEHLTREIARQQKELQKLGINLDRVKEKKRTLMNYADQLKRGLALVFSLSQIKNYIVQLVKIRAEFEMQQRSLEVLLQSKEEADKLWSQTIKLAVKSPFTVKELVTYTKQLAAYRIESEKLYETNKMLADVSAGLGVDMQRLILAFGQVKAANYLRGTELRQFSEAGVNMLGELSKYFTELEGRAISVGEVFEMISKRRVDFGDVEEVFKRITSEGGLFYKMQEKQSETTLGQWRNLIDSLHLMFNEIGQANDGVIKDFIKSLRDMISHWRETIRYILTFLSVSAPFLLFFFNAQIANLKFAKTLQLVFNKLTQNGVGLKLYSGYLNQVEKWTKSTNGALKMLGKTLQWLGKFKGVFSAIFGGVVVWALFEIISLFTEWISSIGRAKREMDRLKDSIAQVTVETQKDLNESIGQYSRLATTLLDVTKSYKEREEAMQSMKRIFADILPDEMLEVENIRKMGSAYKEATDALKLHYATAAEERKKAVIDEKIEPKLQDQSEKIINSIFEDLYYSKNVKLFGNEEKLSVKIEQFIDKEGVAGIYGNLIQDIKDGNIMIANEMELYKELISRIAKYYNLSEKDIRGYSKEISTDLLEELKNAQDLLSKRQELFSINVGTKFNTKEEEEQFKVSQEKKKAYEKEKEALDKLSAAYSTYYGLIKKGIKDEKALNSAQKDVYNAYKELNIELPTEVAFKEISKDALSIKDEVSRVGIFVANKFAKGLEYGAANNPFLKNFVEETIGKDIKEFKGTEWTKAVEDLMRKTAEEFKLDVSIFDKLMVGTETNISDYIKNIESELQLMESVVKAFDVATKNKGPLSTEQLEAQAKLQGTTLAQIEAYRKIIDALKAYAKEFGLDEKNKKNGGASKDWYLELAKGVREYHKDVLKNNKTMDIASAKTLAWEQNMDVLKSALKGVGLTMDWLNNQEIDFSKEDGVIGLLNTIKSLPKITAEQRIEIEKIISNIEGEAKINISIGEVESAERELENMFSNYELTMELESEGLDSDYFLDLFGLKKVSANDIQKAINEKLGDLKLTGDFNNDELIKYISENKEVIGKDYADLYIKILENLNDKERELLQERVKNNMKYAKQALTTIGQIRLSEIQEINAINNEYDAEIERAKGDTERIEKLNADRERALKGVKDKSEQDVNKALWEEFKGSEGFIRIFQDAEYASNRAINNMLDNLERFRDSLSELNIEELKAVVDAMEKLENIKMERFPMVEMFKAMGDLRQNKKNIKDYFSKNYFSKNADNNYELNAISNRRELRQSIKKYDKAIADERERQKGITDEAELKKSDEKIKKLEKQRDILKRFGEEGAKAYAALKEGFGKFGDKIKEVGQSLSTFQNAFENMGVNFSDEMNDAIGTTQEVLGGLGTMIQGFASGNYLQALMGLAQTLGALFQIGDKRKERQIQDNIKAIEKLGKAYEKLEKKIEEAYSIDTLQSATNSAMDNLEEQIQKQEEIIALEKSKKNSDEDKINEYSDELDSQKEQLEEMKKEVVSKATNGAFDDVLSVADEFVDAWLTAFQETGDGLQGLEDNFNDFLLNIVKRQAALSIVGAFTKDMETELKKYVNEKDTKLTADEAGRFSKYVKEELPGLSENLENFFESLSGVVDVTNQGDTMSGLQRGVTEITEETAGVIASYLNTIRFYVADSNTQLQKFLQDYNTSANTYLSPILTQVTNIATDTSEIKSLLSSVISTYTGNASGKGVKMIM